MPPKAAPSRSQNDWNEESDRSITPDVTNYDLMLQLLEQLAIANTGIAALEVERQQQHVDRSLKDPKFPTPPEFSSKISDYHNFIAQCTLTFTMCPNIYDIDEQKVLFIVSLFHGSALSWAREIAENENYPLHNDYLAFKLAMSDVYLDQNYRELCETKLMAFKQTKSAASYSVEFTTLFAPLALNNDALYLEF